MAKKKSRAEIADSAELEAPAPRNAKTAATKKGGTVPPERLFEDREATAAEPQAEQQTDGKQQTRREQVLADELTNSRQRLQAIIEEYETSQEEMKASNEEPQSTNEEPQTVGQENRRKVEELSQPTDDLQNLLGANHVATLFLDRELRIVRFTPRVAEVFNVRAADRGRPLTDLTHRLGYDRLVADAQQVLDTLAPIEREVQGVSGLWYLTRLTPNRSAKDRTQGVVVTLVDITERVRAEQELKSAKEYAESIVETLHEPLLVLNSDLTVRGANAAFYEGFLVRSEETIGRTVYDLGNGQWDIPALRDLLERVLPTNNVFNDYEVSHAFESIGPRVMLLNARRLDHVELILLGIRDITERKRADEELRRSEAAYRALFESSAVGNAETDFESGRLLRVNQQFCELTGYSQKELLSQSFTDLTHPEDRERNIEALEAYRQNPTDQFEIEKRYVRKDGSPVWVHLKARLIDGDGQPRRYLASVFDITKRKTMEAELHSLNESLEDQIAQRTETLRLLQEVTSAANEARTVEEAIVTAMKRLAEHNGWPVGHLWLADEDDQRRLVSSGIWHTAGTHGAPDNLLQEFRRVCETVRFSLDELAFGEVTSTDKPQWIDDLGGSRDSRREAARNAGLGASVAFPVTVDGEVAAVLEFLSRDPVPREERFLEIMPHVGSQLGQVIQRKRIDRMIADAAEREQRRIGQDIHDGLGQELTGLRYMSGTLSEALAAESSPHANVAQRIAESLGTVQTQLRAIVRELVPVEVDREGLVSALRSLAQHTSENYDVACKFECETPLSVENNLLATHVYRIAQEAVNNAVRHGAPKHIIVRLESSDGELRLTVLDDGEGFAPGASAGYGMSGMNFRAELIGGRLSVEPRHEGGAVVRCAAPVSPRSGDGLAP